MLVASVEPMARCRLELEVLFPLHFELLGEPMQRQLGIPVGAIPLAPDWEKYYALERAGGLFLMSLREKGRLVGYWISFCGQGLHYAKNILADMDIWFLDESHRGGVASLVLGRAVQRELRRRGACLWLVGEKLHRPAGRLYESLGFQPVERYWGKAL